MVIFSEADVGPEGADQSAPKDTPPRAREIGDNRTIPGPYIANLPTLGTTFSCSDASDRQEAEAN
jgi:hypothetical protein